MVRNRRGGGKEDQPEKEGDDPEGGHPGWQGGQQRGSTPGEREREMVEEARRTKRLREAICREERKAARFNQGPLPKGVQRLEPQGEERRNRMKS